MSEAQYLKRSVVMEPLFNQWYAWPYLVPPACAAMYVANAHLKMMESFVAAPQVHVAALKNPAMLGGPFLAYGPERVPAVRGLLERTRQKSAPLLELAQAIAELERLLQAEGRGLSLEGLYPRVPEALRGLVELVYDLRGNPSVRPIEALLYRSRFYDEQSQGVALFESADDQRPFVFSTPRLRDEAGRSYLDVPFRHDALDALFRARDQPARPQELAEALGTAADGAFLGLFGSRAPEPRARFEEDGLRVRYLGHACVLVETRGVSLLFDPLVPCEVAGGLPRYGFADLPERIDYVVLTHAHQDHVLFETLLQLRHKVGSVVVPKSGGGERCDPSLALILEAVGFPRVLELGELAALPLPGGRLLGLPFLGEHADLAIRSKLAYALQLEGRSVVLAADSNNLEPRLYDEVRRIVGRPDLLFLGMECDGAPMSWLYGPLLTVPLVRKDDQSRRFNASDHARASAMVGSLEPGEVYVYAMGQEPWCAFLTSLQYDAASRPILESDRLVAECRGRGVPAERLYGRKELRLPARA